MNKEMKEMLYKSQHKRVMNVISRIGDDYPAMSIVLNRMNFKPSEMIPTLAVRYDGLGIFNPVFTNNLTDSQMKFVLMHECMHLYLNHFPRFIKFENIDGYDKITNDDQSKVMLWNVASDSFINETLFSVLPSNCAIDDCVDYTKISAMINLPISSIKNKSTEEVYALLLKEAEKNQSMSGSGDSSQDGQQQQQQGNGTGMNGGDSSSDNGDGDSNKGDEEDKQNNSSGSSKNSGDASEEDSEGSKSGSNDGGAGNQVSGLDKEINDIIEKAFNGEHIDKSNTPMSNVSPNSNDSLELNKLVQECNVDWKEVLSDFVYNISGKVESNRSWHKPSKRYRNIYPISKGRKRKSGSKDFTFSIDVSGSMDKEKISKAAKIVVEYAKENFVNCKYYFWSNGSTKIFNYSSDEQFKKDLDENYMQGGTNLDAALHDYNKEGIGEGLVIITDMEFYGFDVANLDRIGIPIAFIDIVPEYDGGYKDTIVNSLKDAKNARYSKCW